MEGICFLAEQVCTHVSRTVDVQTPKIRQKLMIFSLSAFSSDFRTWLIPSFRKLDSIYPNFYTLISVQQSYRVPQEQHVLPAKHTLRAIY